DKPMSFTSLHVDVDVTLPPNTKASLKMRTDRGEVLTDFDVQIQQRPATPSPFVFVAPPQPPLPPLPPLPPRADSSERDRETRAAPGVITATRCRTTPRRSPCAPVSQSSPPPARRTRSRPSPPDPRRLRLSRMFLKRRARRCMRSGSAAWLPASTAGSTTKC